MARALRDVLHHFDPQLAGRPAAADGAAAPVGLAVPPGDLLRLGAAWNLAVEVARLGVEACVLASEGDAAATPWPAAEPGPLGARLAVLEPGSEGARAQAVRACPDGLCLACLEPGALERALAADLDWALLLGGAGRGALRETGRAALRLLAIRPDARIGVCIHGVRSVGEARDAFLRLAEDVERESGRVLESYGLLVDDLALYRAVVERRPVGLARPQSPAARALADVAGLLVDDAGLAP